MRGVRRPALAVALAVLAAVLLVFPGLGAAPFDDPGEGQHAEIAREAWLGGDWTTLHLNGVRYLDKPPLLYAMTAAAYEVWGVSEWAARLAPAVGAVAAVAATAQLGARLAGPLAGLSAGAGLLGCALFAAFARYARPETIFVAAIQWGFTGLLLGLRATGGTAGRAWILSGCAALGLAALAKDPLGALAPVVTVGIALALAGRLRPVSRWLPASGLALLLVVGFAWHALAAMATPGFVWYSVVDNHVLNAARLRVFPDEDVPLSGPEFLAVSMLGAFPWVIGAALMVADLARRRAWRDPAEAPWIALGLWAGGVLSCFTLSPFTLPHYGLPAYPAIALLAARWWTERPGRVAIGAHLAAFAAAAALLGLAALGDGRVFSEVVFSSTDVETRKEQVAGAAVPAIGWSDLEPLVARGAVIFGVGAAGLAAALWRSAPRLALVAVTATSLATVPLVAHALGQVSSARAVRSMALEVARRAPPAVIVAHEGPIEQSGALELYSGRRPVLVDATRSVLGFGARFADSAELFWDGERLRREWVAGRDILLVTPRRPEQSVVGLLPADRVHLLVEDRGRRLYANAPAR